MMDESSVGMMKFHEIPKIWKNEIHVPNHQPVSLMTCPTAKLKKKTALLSNTTQVPHSWLHKLPQFLDEHPITSQHVDHFAEISIGFLLKKTENLSYPPSFAAFTGTGVLVVSLYLSFISPTLVARSIFFR